MLGVTCLLTGGLLALLWAEREALRGARRHERWLCLGIVLACYLVVMADCLFPHSFAFSPALERLVTGLFPQAAA